MKSFKDFIGMAFVLALLVSVASFPALAQDCGSACEKSCGESCDKSTAKAGDDCCGTCQDKSDCIGTCQEKADCCGTCGGTCQETAAFDMSAMMDCAICSRIMNEMDLMVACNYNVNDIDDGLMFSINLNQPELMTRLREFQKNDKVLYDSLKARPYAEVKDQLCPACAKYLAFSHRGLKEETIDTTNGTVVISRTDDPKLLTELHAWGDQMRTAMADYEAQEMAIMADASCCGTCGGSAHAHLAEGQGHAHAVVGDTCPVTGKTQGACTAVADGKSSCGSSCGDTKAACGTACSDAKASCGDTCPVTGKSGGACPSTAKGESSCGMDLTDMSAFASCHACSVMMENPQYMTMATCKVVSLDYGMVIYSAVKDPKDVKTYHALNDKFMSKVAEVQRMPRDEADKKMCPVCKAFADFEKNGASVDQKNTAEGSLTVISSNNPAEIKKIQILAKQFQGMNKAHEESNM